MGKRKKVQLRLREVMDEKGISSYRLAKLLDKNASNVFVYLQKDYNPTLRTLEKLAIILDCKVCDLIDE